MSGLPLTRNRVLTEREDQIRTAVRRAVGIPFEISPSRLAEVGDAGAFLEFLSDPSIHTPIYNLPNPLTLKSVANFIARKRDEQQHGQGLLFLRFDQERRVIGYSEFDIWPEWGAGDLGGALRRDHQGKGEGVGGAQRTFSWMFDELLLELIVATGAPDNIRTARMLDGLGLERKGEIVSQRPDGSTRPSLVWEIGREAWRAKHQSKV